MSDLRCPRCGAVRRPGDQWCGLCFADFREPPPVVGDAAAAAEMPPPPAAPGELAPPLIRPPGAVAPPPAAQPAPRPVPTIPAQPAQPFARPAPFVPSTNPLAPTPAVPTQLPAGVAPTSVDTADPAGDADPEAAGDQPAWPCPRCGETVPMTEDYCAGCGHGFLDDVRKTTGTKLPLVGDVSKLNSGQKLAFGSVIAVAIIVGILLLLAVGGAIFH